MSAYTALDAVRQAAGAGLVAQSIGLNVAAAAHAKYLTTNITTVTDFHIEDAAKPNFDAVSPPARMTKAGCTGTFSTEAIGGTGASLLGRIACGAC